MPNKKSLRPDKKWKQKKILFLKQKMETKKDSLFLSNIFCQVKHFETKT